MKKSISLLLFTLVLGISNLFAQTDKPFIGGGGVVNGKAINLVKPEYPPAAKAVGAEGAVNVQVTIDEQGNVFKANSVSGHPLLRSASEKAALASTFSPTFLSGQAVKVTGVVVYNFVADKPKISANQTDKKIKGEILNGKAKKLPLPKYPAAAKAVKAEGTVMVEVIVNELGDVISANAVSGHALLRKDSEKAALKAKFSPTKLKGKPVKIKGVLVYNFYVQ